MKIFIPSHKRVDTLKAKTLAQIPKNWLEHTIIVVRTNEALAYGSKIKNVPVILGVTANGIAQTRHAIGDYCMKANIKQFVMLDDDLVFYRRKDGTTTELIKTSPLDMSHMFSEMRRQLTHHAMVGISTRQGNNSLGEGSQMDLYDDNCRILRAMAFNTRDFLGIQPARLALMEDFDTTLQLLRQGKTNRNLYWWAQDQAMTQAAGGCSEYRTHDMHESSARALQALHPAFVQLVEKINKGGGEFGWRTEVRIQWKLAAEEGRKCRLRLEAQASTSCLTQP
jgi:hypothetical protein